MPQQTRTQIQHAVERHQRGVDRRLRLEQAHARNTTHRSPPHRWEKTLVAVHADPLCDVEGGAASQLYHYLWLKDPASRNTQREYKLPDTVHMRPPPNSSSRPPHAFCIFARARVRSAQVVYKYRLPTFWYFTSSQSGEVSLGRGTLALTAEVQASPSAPFRYCGSSGHTWWETPS